MISDQIILLYDQDNTHSKYPMTFHTHPHPPPAYDASMNPIQTFRSCCHWVLCCRSSVVWLDLIRNWSLHEHEHATVECIANCISDWIDLRADHEPDLST